MGYFKTIILFPKKYVEQEHSMQDVAIADKVNKSYVDQENTTKDNAIAGKASSPSIIKQP